jgi:hypothetical protein
MMTFFNMTAFWDIAQCSLEVDRRFRGLMMIAVRNSETSVFLNEITLRSFSKGCLLHTKRREKL